MKNPEYGAQQLKGDVLRVVPWIASQWGQEYYISVNKTIQSLCARHGTEDKRDIKWWRDRISFSNYIWMIEALSADGNYEMAAFFMHKNEDWEESLHRLTHFFPLIRKWKDGRLHADIL